jgi:hypothetical protein
VTATGVDRLCLHGRATHAHENFEVQVKFACAIRASPPHEIKGCCLPMAGTLSHGDHLAGWQPQALSDVPEIYKTPHP